MDSKLLSSLREQFLLDPQVIYLNHGSFGATPRPVFESYQRWQRELERQPTAFFGRASALLQSAREALAGYLGTASPNLAFVTNATTGLNVIARCLDLGPGDEVLATDHEYGALDRTWNFLAQKHGYKYINQAIPLPVTTPDAFIDELWKGVNEHTRVIFISHITSPTALTFPVQEVCRRAREQGLLTVIDGAHAPGQLPLNLDELGADFYSGNLHKWLCAPKGAAFLYARPEHHSRIEPLVVSWGWQSESPGISPLIDAVEWQGTRDFSAFLAVPDAIQFQEAYGWDSVREYCHQETARALQEVSRLTGLAPLSPVSREWFTQMVSIPIPAATSAAELRQALSQQFAIEIPVVTWREHKLVRLSYQAYNTREHTEALIHALACLLPCTA